MKLMDVKSNSVEWNKTVEIMRKLNYLYSHFSVASSIAIEKLENELKSIRKEA